MRLSYTAPTSRIFFLRLRELWRRWRHQIHYAGDKRVGFTPCLGRGRLVMLLWVERLNAATHGTGHSFGNRA